jgi:hypothetical protein
VRFTEASNAAGLLDALVRKATLLVDVRNRVGISVS